MKEQIKSTDWLTRGMTKEEIEREKEIAIMSADLELHHTEMNLNGDIYTDYDATAEKMVSEGYHKQKESVWSTSVMFDVPTQKITGYTHICQSCFYLYKDKNQYGNKFCPNCGAKMKGGAE